MAVEGRGEENVMRKERGEELNMYVRKRNRGRNMIAEEMQEVEKNVKKSRDLVSTEEPSMRRPARERKVVERFSFPESEKEMVSKGLIIKKGRGMQLKEIPNVACKLSKRKVDSNLHLLHRILFKRKSNKYHLKRNISQFSGFVWVNEEKERAKLKQKIDKCVMKSLFDLCDLLDIPVSKGSKKVELSEKLLQFLECPHATLEVSLEEEEQSTRDEVVFGAENHTDEEQDDLLLEEGGNPLSQSRNQKKDKQVQGSRAKRANATTVKKDSASKSAVQEGIDVSKASMSKSKGSKTASCQGKKSSTKQAMSGAEISTEGQTGESKACLMAKAEPSQQEMMAFIAKMLPTVDFDHTTFSDIQKELEAHFNIDLSHHEAEVRSMIEETILNNMPESDEEEEEEEEGEENEENGPDEN